jgi:hypothetical protein
VPGGVAAEADEDLMHEELSRYRLDPPGYLGRVFGWSRAVGGHRRIFAVYRNGVWKTKELSWRGLGAGWGTPTTCSTGFYLRILGWHLDLAPTTGGVARYLSGEACDGRNAGGYSLVRFLDGEDAPTERRLPG